MARLLTLDAAGRRRWFLIWQLPVVVLSALLAVTLAAVASDLLTRPSVVGGFVLVLLASAATLPLPVRFLVLVPVADIAAIAAIRSESVTDLRSISAIALIPIICLGFHFRRPGVATAAIGAALLTALPFLRVFDVPDGTEWIGLLALPVVSVVLAVMAHRGSAILASRSKQLGVALATAHDQLEITRAIIEVLPIGLAYHGPDGERRLANRRTIDLAVRAGMDLEHPQRPATAVWREDRISRVAPEDQFVTRALAGEDIEAEIAWLGEPGDQVAVAVSAHQVRGEDGTFHGTVIVSLDVTELVESVRVRDQFLSTLSHELRTPLVSVVGYLDIIADELEGADQEIVDMLETARRGARTLTERISHLLVAGSQDRLTIDLDRVDLAALVRSVADRHRPGADDRGVDVRCALEPVVTTADPHKLELVVDNLVSNAVKHTGAGGTVDIALRYDERIRLVVADTGRGLERHESNRVFDRFYRTESARRDAVQGLGLGLSICKAVVEAHGGEIDLVATPGQGTTVTVALPPRAG